MKLRILKCAISCLALLAADANAATMLVDFATPAGSTGSVAGNQWNTVSNLNSANSLVDTGNISTGVTLTITALPGSYPFSGYGGGAFNNSDTGTTAPTFLLNGGGPIGSAIGDGLISNNALVTLSLTGLAANTSYEFIVYGGRNDTSFSSLAQITSTDGATVLASYQNRESATFSLTSNESGSLAFRFNEFEATSSSITNVTLVGMSITQIPEPATILLGGLGILGVLRRRRN